MSQQEAATQIGVSRTTLSGWENGEPIDEVYMPDITRVLGGSKGWVRYGEGKPPEGYDETGLPEILESDLPTMGHHPTTTTTGAKKKRRQA